GAWMLRSQGKSSRLSHPARRARANRRLLLAGNRSPAPGTLRLRKMLKCGGEGGVVRRLSGLDLGRRDWRADRPDSAKSLKCGSSLAGVERPRIGATAWW